MTLSYSEWAKGPVNSPPPVSLDFATWGSWLKTTVQNRDICEWRIAVLLAFGERMYGQTYVQVAEDVGCGRGTLYNHASVVRAFENFAPEEVEVRRKFSPRGELLEWKPCFTHYRELANRALEDDERRKLLAEVKDRRLTTEQTGKLVKEYLKARSLPEEESAPESLPARVNIDTPGSVDGKRPEQIIGEGIAAQLPQREIQPIEPDNTPSPFDATTAQEPPQAIEVEGTEPQTDSEPAFQKSCPGTSERENTESEAAHAQSCPGPKMEGGDRNEDEGLVLREVRGESPSLVARPSSSAVREAGSPLEEVEGTALDLKDAREELKIFKDHYDALLEHATKLEAERDSLLAKLAGELVELDEDHAGLLDKIVKYRRSKFPKDESIDRQSETQTAIRRRWNEIQRSR